MDETNRIKDSRRGSVEGCTRSTLLRRRTSALPICLGEESVRVEGVEAMDTPLSLVVLAVVSYLSYLLQTGR